MSILWFVFNELLKSWEKLKSSDFKLFEHFSCYQMKIFLKLEWISIKTVLLKKIVLKKYVFKIKRELYNKFIIQILKFSIIRQTKKDKSV